MAPLGQCWHVPWQCSEAAELLKSPRAPFRRERLSIAHRPCNLQAMPSHHRQEPSRRHLVRVKTKFTTPSPASTHTLEAANLVQFRQHGIWSNSLRPTAYHNLADTAGLIAHHTQYPLCRRPPLTTVGQMTCEIKTEGSVRQTVPTASGAGPTGLADWQCFEVQPQGCAARTRRFVGCACSLRRR